MSNSEPLISVVMPVYNCEKYVGEAIESILNQTYTNLELIIIDDASSDLTKEVIKKYSKTDDRVHCISNGLNYGVAKSLNIGFLKARGEYIARMDADDVSTLTRLETQWEYLSAHPNTDLIGSWGEVIDECSNFIGIWEMPQDQNYIKWVLLWDNPFIHSSIMVRKKSLPSNQPYNIDVKFAQDYELWLRMSSTCHFNNLPLSLIKRRNHGKSIGSTHGQQQKEIKKKLSVEAMNKLLSSGVRINIDFFNYIENPTNNIKLLTKTISWINLIQHNFIDSQSLSRAKIRKIKINAAKRMLRLLKLSGCKVGFKNALTILMLRPRYIKQLMILGFERGFE